MPPIYHFTNASNVRGILDAGGLRCSRDALTKVVIGHREIKGSRTSIDVPCGPGGRVGDYVPFYFAPRSPMLFSIHRGNVQGVDPDQSRLVYLVSSTEAIYAAGLRCVFTNGNAAVYITDFDDDQARIATHVDWVIMRERYWRNTPEDGDRVRRRMAEFLVHEHVPLALFSEIGVYDANIKTAFENALGHRWQIDVRIRRNWYF
jgi:hypothetical protein